MLRSLDGILIASRVLWCAEVIVALLLILFLGDGLAAGQPQNEIISTVGTVLAGAGALAWLYVRFTVMSEARIRERFGKRSVAVASEGTPKQRMPPLVAPYLGLLQCTFLVQAASIVQTLFGSGWRTPEALTFWALWAVLMLLSFPRRSWLLPSGF